MHRQIPAASRPFRTDLSLPLQKHWKCKDAGGRWRAHKDHCKRDAIAERDVAFANPDLLSVDNSYIVITNAAAFQHTELEVLKQMVIMPDEDDDNPHASFEGHDGGDFYSEGQLTTVRTATTHSFTES